MSSTAKRFAFASPVNPAELPSAPPEPSPATLSALDAVAKQQGFPSREPSAPDSAPPAPGGHAAASRSETMSRVVPKRRAGQTVSLEDPPHTLTIKGPTSRLNRFVDVAVGIERESGRRLAYWEVLDLLLDQAGYDKEGRKVG